MTDPRSTIASIFLLSVTGIPPPRWSLRGGTRAYVTVQVAGETTPVRSKVSPISAAPVWRETLPPLAVTLASTLAIQIYRRSIFPGFSRLISAKTVSVAELAEMQRCSADGPISLAMESNSSEDRKQLLNFFLRMEDLTATTLMKQIVPMTAPKPIPEHLSVSQTFSHIIVRLGLITQFAQFYPGAAVALAVVSSVAKALGHRIASNTVCADILRDIERVLGFVKSAELLPRIALYAHLIPEILICVVNCVRHIFDGRDSGILDILSLNSASRLKHLEALKKTLLDLESQMSHAVMIDGTYTAHEINKKVTVILDRQTMAILKPVEMPIMFLDGSRPSCLPGTRTDIISQLTTWAVMTSDDCTRNVFWLTGPAGSGKSTIATTLVEGFRRIGLLGSFVYFNHDVLERANPSATIRTIAHQLAASNAHIAKGIMAAVNNYPLIAHMDATFQFEQLILEPAKNMTLPCDPILIIIDALDEGMRGNHLHPFLSGLVNGIEKCSKHIRILITSRREVHISQILSGHQCVLEHNLNDTANTKDDIRRYISVKLADIRKYSTDLPRSWPQPHLIEGLVEQTSSLFIWATVAGSYIANSVVPMEVLDELVDSCTFRDDTENSLDHLYARAVADAENWNSHNAEYTHNCLTVIILAQNPLSVQSIADILGYRPSAVSSVVSKLRSVLNTDKSGDIRVVHPSFADYLTNSQRCSTSSPWSIDIDQGHNLLALRCLDVLSKKLKREYFRLDTSTDLTPSFFPRYNGWTVPQFNIPASTEYSASAWIDHASSVRSPDLLPNLHTQLLPFYSSHFLPWLELLSLVGRSRDSISSLRKLHSWCISQETISSLASDVREITYDSWRFASTFSQTIEAHPLLVYETALAFLPKSTPIYRHLDVEYLGVPNILVGGLDGWNSCLYSANRDMSIITDFSLGTKKRMIAAATKDRYIRLLDWDTGRDVQPPLGKTGPDRHLMNLTSVQFSGDNSLIFAASADETIYCWDVKTGQLKAKLVDPELPPFEKKNWRASRPGRVHSIAILRNENLLVAGRQDSAIILWRLDDYTKDDHPLVGHTGAVYSLHSSTDGNMLVSGAEDCTVRLWDIRTRTCLKVYGGHSGAVKSVALSPDMSQIVSGSMDGTVHISGAGHQSVEASVLGGHLGGVLSVAYSPDGKFIASAGNDDTIRVWSIDCIPQLLHEFPSYTGPVYSIIFCDATTLASGSVNGEIQIWNVSGTNSQGGAWVHKAGVNAVALSHSGDLIASAADDSTLVLWSTKTGKLAVPPIVHDAGVKCVAFSPDDGIIASTSRDMTVRFCDTVTGNIIGRPLKFTANIQCLAFSEHGSTLAIGLADGTIELWNTIVSECDRRLTYLPHQHLCAMAFSSQPGKFCSLVQNDDGALSFLVWNEHTGSLLVEATFTLCRQNDIYIELPAISFSTDGESVIVRYHYSSDGQIEVRAFDLSTQIEAPTTATASRRGLYAQNAEIYHADRLIMALPRDFRARDIVQCWTSVGDVIAIGMQSGRVYAIDFGPRLRLQDHIC
ncbi:hypothetical protein C8R43DRAFT_1127498 [Mycena crocata]|nr:hypothetical protein C8R43DRAFT_1127498 [Mycena crocata]